MKFIVSELSIYYNFELPTEVCLPDFQKEFLTSVCWMLMTTRPYLILRHIAQQSKKTLSEILQ